MKLYTKKSVIGFLFLLIFILFSAPSFALALELDYPAIPTPIGPLDLDTITDEGGFTVAGLIVFIYGAAVWVGGILAFISLVYVGFVYILSGSGMVGRGKALRQLKNVLWGLVILLFVTVLLNIVNPEILNLEDSLVVAVAPNDKTYIEVEFEGFKFEGFFVDNGGGDGESTVYCQEQCLAKCGGAPACETECFKLPKCSDNATCANGEEPPPPSAANRVALCTTGTECAPWCWEPKGNTGTKGPAEVLRTSPQYTDNWPAIYPASCTVALEELRQQWGGSASGWMRVSAINNTVAGYSAFLTGLQNAGREAKRQGYLLNMFSGYRPLYDQVRVLCWNEGRNASPSAMQSIMNAGKVAKPGRSPHGVGVAVDVELRTADGSTMARTCAYAIKLKKIIFDSDPNWYRLSNEYWHFEYWPNGSPGSTRIRDYGTCAGF